MATPTLQGVRTIRTPNPSAPVLGAQQPSRPARAATQAMFIVYFQHRPFACCYDRDTAVTLIFQLAGAMPRRGTAWFQLPIRRP
jgi:hypothetical protein